MDKRNTQQEQGRWQRKRKNRLIPVLFFVVLSAVFVWGISAFIRWYNWGNKLSTHTLANQLSGTIYNAPAQESTQNSNSKSTSTDSEWNLILVNKWNAIPENYAVNLVEVPGGEKVDERIYKPLMEMLEAAKEGNWDQLPEVVSGYRTGEIQQALYDEKIEEYKEQGYSEEEAVKQAQQWVSVPAYSEHQLGLAVDINGATYDLYFWLQENSYKYGFIFRYPAGKTDMTGVAEEVWHYRYVGVDAATEMYEEGLCLEEYLEKIKQ